MINDAVEYIRKELRDYLGLTNDEVLAGDIHVLKDGANGKKGVFITVVNVEEEPTLRNTTHVHRENGAVRYREPPVHVNLYLLVAFVEDLAGYGKSLKRLSSTIENFQHKRHYSAANASPTNAFPTSLERLVVDLHNLDFEQMNHLWGILGGSYFPSVLYKVRLVRIQKDETLAGKEITTISVDTAVL